MTGLLLRLAGPLQSWGEHSIYTERDTQAFPTRSGLLGMIASAVGIQRGKPLGELSELQFTVRVDRPGVRLVDFHTIGGGLPQAWTAPTAEGGRRPRGSSTIVTRRHYLSDAAFAVAVSGPVEQLERVVAALRNPVWQPYLGRRSCPPEQPVLLGGIVSDPLERLMTRLPLSRNRPWGEADTVAVDIIRSATDTDRSRTIVADDCEVFAARDRRYRNRFVTVESVSISAGLCHGVGERYLRALSAYLHEEVA